MTDHSITVKAVGKKELFNTYFDKKITLTADLTFVAGLGFSHFH